MLAPNTPPTAPEFGVESAAQPMDRSRPNRSRLGRRRGRWGVRPVKRFALTLLAVIAGCALLPGNSLAAGGTYDVVFCHELTGFRRDDRLDQLLLGEVPLQRSAEQLGHDRQR